MPSTWTHLLFFHGHVADADLALRLVDGVPDPGGHCTRWRMLLPWLGTLGRRAIHAFSR